MGLAEYDEMVKALATDRSDNPFDIRRLVHAENAIRSYFARGRTDLLRRRASKGLIQGFVKTDVRSPIAGIVLHQRRCHP